MSLIEIPFVPAKRGDDPDNGDSSTGVLPGVVSQPREAAAARGPHWYWQVGRD